MPNEEVEIENFVEDNQRHLLQLLFFEIEGEWDQIVGEDPNSKIIGRLGNPRNMDELISCIENEIQTVTYKNQISEYVFSLEKVIENYKNRRLDSFPASPASPRIAFNVTIEDSSRTINLDTNKEFSGVFFGSDNRTSPNATVSSPKAEDSCLKKLSRFFTNC